MARIARQPKPIPPAAMFAFACAVAAISGAVGGAAIDTTPIQRAGIGVPDYLRDTATYAFADDAPAEPALPDHYDMITPEGRIEVAELTARGIFSKRRYAWYDDAPLPPLPTIRIPPEPEAWTEEWASVSEREPAPPPPLPAESTVAPEPQLIPAPADDGTARLIHVQAELAIG